VNPRQVECPYCHAKPGEPCRTQDGNRVGRFGGRINHYRREVAARRQAEGKP
jgi:hypothetical protein